MLAPDWSWFAAIPIVLATVALLWIPGSALAGGLGAGRWPSIALAPLMTTTLVSVGGILTALAGMRWEIGAALFWLLAIPALVWVVRWAVTRSGRKPWTFAPPSVRWWEVGVGLAATIAIAVWVFYVATVRPGNIPHQSDQIFHLGLVRYMLDSGSISSLTADGFNHPSTPSFYPAAMHGISATLVLLTGAPIVVVENSLLLVSCALIYPLGMMLMLNTLVAEDRRLVLLTGFLVLMFTSFPWRVMVWGALWAQVYGSVFIPAVLAVYGWGLLQVFRRQNWGSAALLFLVAVPGMSLGHTSSTLAAAAAAILFSFAVSVRHALTAGRGVLGWLPAIGFALVGIAAPAVGVLGAPAGLAEPRDAHLPAAKIVIGLLTFWSGRGDVEQWAAVALTGLALIGVVVSLLRKHDWWMVAIAAIFLALGTIIAARGSTYVWPLTWPWYNWHFRVLGVAVIFALPLVIIGASWLLHVAGRMRGRLRPLAVLWTVLVSAGLLLLVVIQARLAVAMVAPEYQRVDKGAWITTEKIAALEEVSRAMPPDAVVAANPWRGGQYLYIVGTQRMVIPSEKSDGVDIELIQAGLKNVISDQAVCAAVKRQDLRYVITGGFVTAGNEKWYAKYAAVDEVSESGGFRVAHRADPYVLWQVPDCAVG